MWIDGQDSCTATVNPGCGSKVTLSNGQTCKSLPSRPPISCWLWKTLLITLMNQTFCKAVATATATCWMGMDPLTVLVTSLTHRTTPTAGLSWRGGATDPQVAAWPLPPLDTVSWLARKAMTSWSRRAQSWISSYLILFPYHVPTFPRHLLVVTLV
jgi:hypothetical protein